MGVHNIPSKEMRLVLSSDAKPRLKWTSELHQRFVDAVDQLGGAEKATPKSLMRVMGVHGLTLYHLKSHLQKYRMGRSQHSQTSHHNKQEEYGEKMSGHFTNKTACDGAKEHINESTQMTRALQMQMEVQRKLHEQIEVQKHLQLRVEAQGKYLQSVLRKAEDTISEYGSCSMEAENARAQLAELVSMVNSTCPSSEFTHKQGSLNKVLRHHGSLESSLTSSSEGSCCKHDHRNFISLSLMEMHPPTHPKHPHQSKRLTLWETIDLNCKQLNDFDSAPKLIDLNSKGDGSF